MSETNGLEVWGGLECSRVRIGDDIRDQILDTGHRDRPEDLELIASLGIKTLRYPVLWETVSKAPGEQDFGWHDYQLGRLRAAGISPIVGLVHHGSGPAYCDILDPAFPASLARHARDVAARYPWVERFTPINEPMTTARLCGLYGHWYPHACDEAACFRIVVAECRAISACMRELRLVSPHAKLIQTEDIGRVFATASLQYQADYENERRWLALDLLAGRVRDGHPFHRRLLDHGVDERHLAELADHPCNPNVIGIDHYLTSDRFLDERIKRHPGDAAGGNGRDSYVDIAAARAGLPESESGFLPRICEAWERYKLPVALTEVHNGCTREEQLRWLMDGWNAASAARNLSVDVRAVAVWSLFGSTDWNSLLTRRDGFYEPGAFDIRFDPPRPTVIASAARALVRSGSFDHPVLARRGWWRSDDRHALTQPIAVSSSRGLEDVFRDCCALRRLDMAEETSTAGEPYATIQAHSGSALNMECEGEPRQLTLTCHYKAYAQDSLVVQVDRSITASEAVHAFLDLVIDGTCGWFRVARAGQGQQLAFEPAASPPVEAELELHTRLDRPFEVTTAAKRGDAAASLEFSVDLRRP